MKRDVENFVAALRAANVEEGFLPVVAPCSISPSYATEYYKSENVIASTDCGFAQGAGIAWQDVRIVWAKLDALALGAGIATRRLWKH